MKRDMELIIEILKCIEEGWRENFDRYFSEIEDEHLWYNVGLTKDYGLIEANKITTTSGEAYRPIKISWEGHDFLDAARNEAVVKSAKEIAKRKGVELFSLSFSIVKSLLEEGAKQLLFGK